VLIVDANVLVYATDEDAPLHGRAREWLLAAFARGEAIGFAWVVLLAFVRLSTHVAVFPRPLTPEQAVDVVDLWLRQPASVVLEPGHRHSSLLRGLLLETGTAGNLVNDAHLAALALEHGATIVSFDRDFGRFEGVRWRLPEAP
jgi:toxin-antitoxin system PIN domain toxin